MTELKQLRDFAEEVNGVRPTERSLKGVVNNLINNYKGGSGGNDSFFSLAEFANYVRGKVLDVDKTVELFDEVMEEVGYPNYTEISIKLYDFKDTSSITTILGFYLDSSNYLTVCDFAYPMEIESREDLITAKETIETTPIEIYTEVQNPFVVQAIFTMSASSNQKIISYERLKSLFKEYTPTNE